MLFSNLVVAVALQALTATAAGVLGKHHGHGHLHQHFHRAMDANADAAPTPTASSLEAISAQMEHAGTPMMVSDAAKKVAQALEVLAVLNKERYENVTYNKYEFVDAHEVVGQKINAPPLNYTSEDIERLSSSSKTEKRDETNGNPTDRVVYSISPELAEAARILAESKPPTPSTGEEARLARDARMKYHSLVNDTNTPQQAHRHSNGLYEYADMLMDQMLLGDRSSVDKDDKLVKRASPSSYWLEDMEQLGASPYAPSGYKVFRNVKDYGAKGDGVTDDTAAINKAIADGNRCGADCGSSTIYPAVVYFPSGTYLVSSPIIQYYNTQFLGNPGDYPTILAAASFVGLGVITSDVYVGDQDEWYINTNNFLRNVRNFKMDITRTDPNAYVCAIHWQVAQGTSLENIEFYMSQAAGNTQQGIYMENGSGGFMANLTFVGGNFGAYFGNQQFTTSQLVFVQCTTAMQIHWDWAWTMQDVVIESCGTGIIITGGVSLVNASDLITGQGVGSFILIDAIIANTPTGIVTSLSGDNSTAFLLQNVGFFNVQKAITVEKITDPILAGGNEVLIDAWGFGLYGNSSGVFFAQENDLPVMERTSSLVGSNEYVKSNLFTRRRPQYYDLKGSQVFDVKAYGAKGDGTTDDTAVLNSVLSTAANLSSIVYIPYGIYVIKDTLKIPKGSRIMGQAWSQIMATGEKFQDMEKPHVAVKVGDSGDEGIVEIQDLLFTVSGPTAGAILVEWNIHESTQGSAGLWDSHFRVGGAKGSKLQATDCPKEASALNENCIAASLLMHITPSASAYMENIWAWTADHDLDIASQDQIDVYSARGILIESSGPTWLYGTASEHSVLYQYQISNAENLVMGMLQTEAPYFQPSPKAPAPVTVGLFPNDPTFADCAESSLTCAVAWAVRVIDSSTIYMLGSGIYSWFSSYSQDCLDTDHCQDRAFYIEQSSDVWIFNLVTKGIQQSISPQGETPIFSRDTKNGYTSSLLGWYREPTDIVGERNFTGYYLYSSPQDDGLLSGLSSTCQTAMTRLIDCPDETYAFLDRSWPKSYANKTTASMVCSHGCETSIKTWYQEVTKYCTTFDTKEDVMNFRGGISWAGWNQTCLQDPQSGKYCSDVIAGFSPVKHAADMPDSDLCSYCYTTILQMAQASPYSFYDENYKKILELTQERCSLEGDTDIAPPVEDHTDDPSDFCASDVIYTTVEGDTCDEIAVKNTISSAALFIGSEEIIDCNDIKAGLSICLPFSCNNIYTYSANATCRSIEYNLNMDSGMLRQLNPWINGGCTNLQDWSVNYGHVLCVSPQAGTHTHTAPPPGVTSLPGSSTGYTDQDVAPPENSTVADGTTMSCGRWHTASDGDTCTAICVQSSIEYSLFLAVNPSLSSDACTADLQIGTAYCTGPTQGWGLVRPNSTITTSSEVASGTAVDLQI
ncbi:uncharacterized protein N7484_007400 [Penicillium longicatenatum]|uniref:uncharacterized protein n=1 Tax=Penicillium longicatenatum TaxID=1561947 RepID=UPI0025488B1A|nr:uncharacterized protein N7484_007400 [Penicillium longicatenatum]KAJ5639538.1 hypothetical protein N7484_007400 [Penicillium longicatenatum]